jgi:hypothetical protein
MPSGVWLATASGLKCRILPGTRIATTGGSTGWSTRAIDPARRQPGGLGGLAARCLWPASPSARSMPPTGARCWGAEVGRRAVTRLGKRVRTCGVNVSSGPAGERPRRSR